MAAPGKRPDLAGMLRNIIGQSAPAIEARPCHCTGPQPGKPLCPCRMRNVWIVNGRYIERIDHGPVAPQPPERFGPDRMTAADIGMEE